jgi:hypothetical protein
MTVTATSKPIICASDSELMSTLPYTIESYTSSFIDYVLSFYGHGGIYDYGYMYDEVKLATEIRIARSSVKGATPFEADSIDREYVRDIVAEVRESQLIKGEI